MKFLCFMLFLQISFKECTIDVNIKELLYIADHLTAAECRKLFASLYFTSYDLPAVLHKAALQVPTHIPCIKLLTKWNSGVETWEGKGKTHAIVERRLRQLGKKDLADWLGKFVFHQLAKQVNESLNNEPYLKEHKFGISSKYLKDGDSRFDGEEWTTFDSIISVALLASLFITLATFCRMLKLAFQRAKVKRSELNSKRSEEMVHLMNADSGESDQESLEPEVETNKRSRIRFEDDLKSADEVSDVS